MIDHSYALFTSPANKKTIADLSVFEYKVFEIPVYEIERIELGAEKLFALRSPLNFDWIIFTDVITTELYIEFLAEIDFELYDLDSVRVCAFGETVSDRLRFNGIHSDIIATSIDASDVFKQIKKYVGTENLNALKILELKQLGNDVDIGPYFSSANGEVTQISLYQLTEPKGQTFGKIRALIGGGAIDEFVISDAKDLIFLERLFSDIGLDLNLANFASADRRILQILAERGLSARRFSIQR